MLDQLLNFLIPTASAQSLGGATGAQGGGFSFLIMFVVFFLFIYFAIWRPQNKRAKETQSMLESLAKGDEVLTAGGLLGKIVKISGQYITLSVANNVEMLMQKSAIVNVMPKGTLKSIE